MTRVRTWAPWIALAAVVVVTLGVVATRGGESDADARVDALARELRCPTCVAESVFESRSATADAIRSDLARRVEEGETDDAIKAAYVERYTEWILLTPSNRGIGFVVWAIPVVVLTLGAAGIVAFVRRGHRRRSDAIETDPVDEAIVDELRRGDR